MMRSRIFARYINGTRLPYSFRPPKARVLLVCIFSTVFLFWTWQSSSWSSSPSLPAYSSRYTGQINDNSISTEKLSKLRCVFNNNSLAKKIFDCDRRGGLKSVSPENFRPREVSLTFYGVQGQIGVSWVTFDGRQVCLMIPRL